MIHSIGNLLNDFENIFLSSSRIEMPLYSFMLNTQGDSSVRPCAHQQLCSLFSVQSII